jgi:Uma2 family endonuclease
MATLPKAPKPVPVAPTAEEWHAMSEPARLRLLLEVIDALSDPAITMSEGRPHKKAKSRAADKLGLYFGSIGKVVYVAEEMAVLYPGEPGFTPDIMAVLDVPEPEDDQRMAWVVVEEKKGLDLVIEILHRGDRKKDLEDNVARYARLGIPEYFVYDRLRQRVVGYRLPALGAGKYQPIIPQFGRYHSQVLGLDLAVEHGQLRIFHGMAELFGSDELIGRLKGMVEDLEFRADQTAAQIEQAQAQIEQAQAQAEQAQAQAEQAQAQVEAAAAGVRATLLALLEARGLPCADDVRARVLGCADLPVLQRWLLRGATARSAEEALAGEDSTATR